MTTIWQARQAGWAISLKCHRQREGLKSARPCMGDSRIDLSTLISALGPDVKVAELQGRIVCPTCGTSRVEIKVSQPPSADAGAKDAERPRRQMLPALTMKESTLGGCRSDWVVFVCDQCARRGEIRRDRLIAEFGADMHMPELLEVFAKKRGCALAKPGASAYDPDRLNGQKCKIHYDVDRAA